MAIKENLNSYTIVINFKNHLKIILEMKEIKTFLDLLIELSEDGQQFTDEELRDEVNTFLIAVSKL